MTTVIERSTGVMVRALPRIAGVAAGLALVALDGALSLLGLIALVLAILTSPVLWWRHVVAGVVPTSSVGAAYVEPGSVSVRLESTGDRTTEVIQALRAPTQRDLARAMALIDRMPTFVAHDLSEDSARRVQARLEAAGAVADLSAEGR